MAWFFVLLVEMPTMMISGLFNRPAWLALGLFLLVPAHAEEAPALSKGQTLYLPIFTFIWHGNMNKQGYPEKAPASTLVSIRNVDPARSVRVISARYHDTAGKLLKEYVNSPRTIGPLATYELYVEKRDMTGGSGANFLIEWQADSPVNPLLVEAVHADIQGHRTFSFITTARPVAPEAK